MSVRPYWRVRPLRDPAGITRIGITGHSDLTASSEPIVRDALHACLIGLAEPPWVGVSCLARGADQLFAGLVLELGGRLEVILPARDYRFRKVEPDNAAEFDGLLDAAAALTVLGCERSCRQAYMRASTALLDAVDLVIAVWDGRPAARRVPILTRARPRPRPPHQPEAGADRLVQRQEGGEVVGQRQHDAHPAQQRRDGLHLSAHAHRQRPDHHQREPAAPNPATRPRRARGAHRLPRSLRCRPRISSAAVA